MLGVARPAEGCRPNDGQGFSSALHALLKNEVFIPGDISLVVISE